MLLSREDAKDARSHKDANIRNADIDDSYSLTNKSNLTVVLCKIKGTLLKILYVYKIFISNYAYMKLFEYKRLLAKGDVCLSCDLTS